MDSRLTVEIPITKYSNLKAWIAFFVYIWFEKYPSLFWRSSFPRGDKLEVLFSKLGLLSWLTLVFPVLYSFLDEKNKNSLSH